MVLVTLAVLKLPARTTSQLKLAISGLFLPFFGLATSTQKLAENTGDRIAPRSALISQIDQLQSENKELKLRLADVGCALVEFLSRRVKAQRIGLRSPIGIQCCLAEMPGNQIKGHAGLAKGGDA